MQFQVPQFLDVEDKIIGPFTLKQFLYLAGGIGLGYLSYRFIPFIGIFLGLGWIGFGAALAFYKYNEKPFVFVLESAFKFFTGNRFYMWRKREKLAEKTLDLTNFRPTERAAGGVSMKTTSSKLGELSWSMNMPHGEAETEEERRASELGL